MPVVVGSIFTCAEPCLRIRTVTATLAGALGATGPRWVRAVRTRLIIPASPATLQQEKQQKVTAKGGSGSEGRCGLHYPGGYLR